MILEVTRGHIRVRLGEKTATVRGEMFFPGNNKMGFELYQNSIKNWDFPDKNQITEQELAAILDDIRSDFLKGGHILELS